MPAGIRACLFDLDGVLTQTARIHAVAWKQLFDAYLDDRSRETGETYQTFELTSCSSTWSATRGSSRSRRRSSI
jgi:beta-phosphoglucomutase-like phosphatase (HAD superfamily)